MSTSVSTSTRDPSRILAKEIISSDPVYLASCLPSNKNGAGLARDVSGTSTSSADGSKPLPPRSMSTPSQKKPKSTASDEATPIICEDDRTRRNYQSTEGMRDRRSGADNEPPKDQEQRTTGAENRASHSESTAGHVNSWYNRMVDKFGSLELENKGSVARDHLALERTFLAWLRTSLAFASIGIAVTQLFRLSSPVNSTPSADSTATLPPLLFPALYDVNGMGYLSDPRRLRSIGKPLGATFIGIAILILFIGFHRYFEGQYWIIRGKFPASRGSVALIAFLAAALIITALVVILAVSPGASET
ncbi:hypothetical protein MPDQ_004330 [Monascus purpureus]|uniref:DUF202 domain-containing protein n=1 Tax=Monascus purpureus TaxID=5098 RepID=A0A507R0D2_MONPU|nr:hypothetical protein MPDQ_004330 [Monascus purpureus]BDD64287.1 hypothetical protein MAP00_009120 [Monascus purpureus]